MSQPSRPQARGQSRRSRRNLRIEAVQVLEERALLAPVVTTNIHTAAFNAFTNQPATQNLGNITITNTASNFSAAPYTSVSLFADNSAFGGDIVRIRSGPGGDFGKGVYAISRGAGGNTGAIDRPGVIYRLDPATGKASVFFDLNSVINQLEPGGTAANTLGTASGFVNWYDLAFDSEGYFDGKPSMFVSSVDNTDPNKNVIYRIGADGSFLGAFVSFGVASGSVTFNNNPTAILVPPVEQQSFLRGLLSAGGSPSTSGVGGFGGIFDAVFFDANAFRPGTTFVGNTLPNGVNPTAVFFGPQTAFAPADNDYLSPDYATFTDFGTPEVNGFPGQPGLSGIQGIGGDLLIRDAAGNTNIDPFPVAANRVAAVTAPATATTPSGVDQSSAIGTPFRRFEDAAFDSYGYFSYGTSFTAGNAASVGTPAFTGRMFVADLGTGMSVAITPPGTGTVPQAVPVQGPGVGGFTTDATGQSLVQFPGGNLGGRIIRISPTGVVFPFAEGFNTSGSYFSDSFVDSSLSITFSADGTTLYASDDDGIWQFKTVASLAGSTTGSLVGLNDLRTFGVPYEGQDSAVAIIDTGVDAQTPNLRGRVSTGINILTNGNGNDDLAGASTGDGTVTPSQGHGTPVAGIVAQFVPQATLDPINVFTPFQGNPLNATADSVYAGLDYLSKNAFVKDPVRPNKVDRVVAANMAFGTTQTYDTEATAYRRSPQLVIALKNQMKRLRSLGIAPIAAAGQNGTPVGGTTGAGGDVNGMSLPAVLNEAISVTGSYSFPFTATNTTSPIDDSTGVYPRPIGPVLVVGANNGGGTGADILGAAGTVTANDLLIFKDRILTAANRNTYTDYTAPAVNLPTFAETFAGDGGSHNIFNEGGTSLSSAVVSGSFAVVASALQYWINMAQGSGATADGYLTTPVGVRSLNFGEKAFGDLSTYDNPDAINAILQWTAVPATDSPNTLDTVAGTNPPQLIGSTSYREYSRIDIGNAIAAIEGTIAINYLLQHNMFDVIDGNHNGLITAQEIQTFVDQSATIGMPEAGAMARFLGGTASIGAAGTTVFGEQPDQPDALQRRYNFFDYAADGQLNGAISIDQIRILAHYLLPAPDAFVTVDRQRSSGDGYLLDPRPLRDYANLQHLKPTYVWVPKSAVAKYRNVSPAKFHIGRGQIPGSAGPTFTLFEQAKKKATPSKGTGAGSNKAGTSSTAGGSTKTTGSSTSGSSSSGTVVASNTPASATNTADALVSAVKSVAGVSSNATAANQEKLGTPKPAGTVSSARSTPAQGAETATFQPTSTGSDTVQEKSSTSKKSKK